METALIVVVVLLVAVLAGVALRGRVPVGAADAGDQRTRVAQLETELGERNRQVSEVRAQRDAAQEELQAAREERESIRVELAAVKADHDARIEELAEARKQAAAHFKGIADDVTKANSEAFLKQAKEQFESQKKLSEADLKQRQQAINELVKPVKDNLAKFEQQVGAMEKDRKGAYDVLRDQVGRLRDTAQNLSEALRSPQMRGQWGELQLQNILELSGLRERIDFVEQDTIGSSEGRGRPDAVVHIPGGLEVVIDAKTPLDSYLDAHHADDAQRQSELLNRHANTLIGHAKTLGNREYASMLQGSPDFVVMFVPAEPILDAAMDVKPALWEEAWQKHRVLIATPGLLLAFLRTVAMAWQQQNLQQNAQEIAEGATALYDSLRVYAGHVSRVGKGLKQAVDAYNDSVGSLERNFLPTARKLEELGPVGGAKRIEEVSPVELLPRTVAAPELADADPVLETTEARED